MKTEYSDYEQINSLQREIMFVIQEWVQEKKLPVPRQEVIKVMRLRGSKVVTIEWALNALLRKRYIRRGYTGTNKRTYVQLRSLTK